MSAGAITLPRMAAIKQSLYHAPLTKEGVISSVQKEFAQIGLFEKIKSGQSIAIGAGSRGVASIDIVIKTIVEEVKKAGGIPFVFPAMGSHGGATAEGQVEMLGSLGITEEFIGCQIKSSMEVVMLGKTARGVPVYLDKNASEADGIIIANRIKAHTNFRGEIESGLHKMLAIGAGKQTQAIAIHSMGAPGLRDNVPEVGQAILKLAPVLAGFAVLEDAYHTAAKIVGVEPENFLRVEIELLEEAKRTSPKLPIKDIDILVVERMGKNISGAGMDTNVIGRMRLPEMLDFPEPVIKVIIVLDLTEESHGNAVGIGLADLTVRRLVNKMDFHATYTNALTGNGPQQGALPITLETDREAIETAIKYLLPPTAPENIKLIRIKDTLSLDQMLVSEAVLRQLRGQDGFEVLKESLEITFDESGALL